MTCPVCDKRHRVFPAKCYTLAQNDYTHVVIAKQAAGAAYKFSPLDELATDVWNRMQEYALQFDVSLVFKVKL